MRRVEGYRCRSILFAVLLCPLVIASDAFLASGNAAEPWVRIEEDWELSVCEPDVNSNSPQLTVYLTPDRMNQETYFQVQLNHSADENFLGGGFRVAAIQNEWSADEARSDTREVIRVDGDVVRWTSVMAIREGELLFAIKDGTSQSWGDFGGPDYLVRMPAEGLNDLSRYTPLQSVEDVDIGFGSNRVQSLILLRIRAYRADGTYETVEANLDAS